MKLLLLITLSVSAWAAPGFVQATSGGQAGSSTTITTTAISTTAHNTLVIGFVNGTVCQSDGGSSLTVAVTDTAGNTFYQVGVGIFALNRCGRTWIARDITANASNVITVTFSTGQTNGYATAMEISGANSTTPRDAQFGMGSGTNTSSLTSGKYSTFYADEIVFTFGTEALTNGTWTAPSGFTIPTGAESPNKIITSAYKVLSGTVTANSVTWTNSNAVDTMLVQGITLR